MRQTSCGAVVVAATALCAQAGGAWASPASAQCELLVRLAGCTPAVGASCPRECSRPMAASAHLDGGLGGVRGVVVLAERQAVACSSSQECAGVDVIASLSGVPTDGSVAIGLVRGCAVGGGGRVDLLQDLTSSLGGSACGTGSVSGGEVAAAAGGGDDDDGAVADGVLAWARRGALAVAAVNVTAASNGAEGDSRPLIACAPLVPVGAAECAPCAAQALHPSPEAEGAADTSALAAVAIFTPIVSAEAGTVRGAVAIYPSPDDSAAVRVSVELEGLPAGDVSYHVHSLGVAPGEGVGATAGHWNPLDSPNLGDACNPQDDAEACEAGDLSGKHGALAGPAACTAYDDYGIALSGVRSVVGRSIVLHNSEGARVAAATLEAVGPAGGCDCGAPLGDIALAPSAAVAAFSGDAGGSVHGALVFEEIGDSNGVGVLVSGSFAGLPDTAPLSYHVHTSPIADGGDCSSTGGHFDPTGAGIDFDRCTADADAGECEAGALAEKHGTLPADAACVGFAEFGVRVRGGTQRSVVGRSVVIHDSMGNRVACANIEPLGAGAAPAAWVGACGDGAFANGAAGRVSVAARRASGWWSAPRDSDPFRVDPAELEAAEVDFEAAGVTSVAMGRLHSKSEAVAAQTLNGLGAVRPSGADTDGAVQSQRQTATDGDDDRRLTINPIAVVLGPDEE